MTAKDFANNVNLGGGRNFLFRGDNCFLDSLVAFKIYLDISVTVEGRSYTYKQFL